MKKKNNILALCLCLCIGLSGCIANNEVSSKNSKVEQGDEELYFSLDEVESKKTDHGFALEYEGLNGTCTWLMLDSTDSVNEVLTIAVHNDSDDVKICLVSPDGERNELSIGENKLSLEAGKYRINITGKNSSNKVEILFDKESKFSVKVNEYFIMGYDFDEGNSDLLII